MNGAADISNLALGSFYLLLIIPLWLFHRWQMGLTRTLVNAILRMTLQLGIVAIYLQTLFNYESLPLNLLWLSIMLLVASFSICQRSGLKTSKVVLAILAGQIIAIAIVLPILLAGTIHTTPWWKAQYMIPIAGMLLGNCLTANVLAMERWYSSLSNNQDEYQFYLAMGAPNPAQPFFRTAIKAAMAPQLATMTTLGIVTLPGMMTGQILGGTSPVLGVKYQLVLMVAIFITGILSVSGSLLLVQRMAFDSYGKLKL